MNLDDCFIEKFDLIFGENKIQILFSKYSEKIKGYRFNEIVFNEITNLVIDNEINLYANEISQWELSKVGGRNKLSLVCIEEPSIKPLKLKFEFSSTFEGRIAQ